MRFKEFLESKREPCSGIFFSDGKSVLLLKRAKGTPDAQTWGLPGGHAKGDETPIETANREVTEEIGSVQGQRVGQQNDGYWTCFFYQVPKPFNVKLSGEHDNWKWIKFKDLSEYDLHPEFKKAAKRYIAYFESQTS